MTFDRKRWQEQLDKRIKEKPQTWRQISQSAPKMEVLTASAEWNEFLSFIQVYLDQAEQGINSLNSQLLSPDNWKTEEIVRVKSAILVLQDRLSILKTIIELPKRILDSGEKVDKFLSS